MSSILATGFNSLSVLYIKIVPKVDVILKVMGREVLVRHLGRQWL